MEFARTKKIISTNPPLTISYPRSYLEKRYRGLVELRENAVKSGDAKAWSSLATQATRAYMDWQNCST